MGEEDDMMNGSGRRRFVGAALGGGLAAVCGCLGRGERNRVDSSPATTSDPALSGTIHVSGSSTVYPLTVAVGEQFSAQYPDVSISVSPTGTGGGFKQFFCRGKASINDASRSISSEESGQCDRNEVDPLELRVATDALTVVVNTDADWVDCITTEQLAAMWRTDGATQWSDVDPDWPDEPVELHGPTSDSGTFDYFAEAVIGEVDDHRTDYEGTEYDNAIIQSVSESTYAVGYLGYAYYLQNREAVKALGIDDGDGCVKPSPATAQGGEYTPLSRPLFIYVAENELSRPELRAFVTYYIERAGSSLVSDIGYVPLTESGVETGLERLEGAAEAGER
ncbi:PstS family phosphate ABC transporter substrate-binding protein [Haloprofundus salinisoli]|uniref:PstS family phosphate ABC transporter substrate-binding protein n=1 Tax=Haloprofundus salinisoli TaxID=2876193 RepID=UPI001CCEDA24|nr:PstS family phosphate ABC transporter substrate-binding protein [Haloprofundus salinisoli]